MTEEQGLNSVQALMELMKDYYLEAAAAISDETVTDQVMTLFRNEDLDGIKVLMEMHRVMQEFNIDVQEFINKWSQRMEQISR